MEEASVVKESDGVNRISRIENEVPTTTGFDKESKDPQHETNKEIEDTFLSDSFENTIVPSDVNVTTSTNHDEYLTDLCGDLTIIETGLDPENISQKYSFSIEQCDTESVLYGHSLEVEKPTHSKPRHSVLTSFDPLYQISTPTKTNATDFEDEPSIINKPQICSSDTLSLGFIPISENTVEQKLQSLNDTFENKLSTSTHDTTTIVDAQQVSPNITFDSIVCTERNIICDDEIFETVTTSADKDSEEKNNQEEISTSSASVLDNINLTEKLCDQEISITVQQILSDTIEKNINDTISIDETIEKNINDTISIDEILGQSLLIDAEDISYTKENVTNDSISCDIFQGHISDEIENISENVDVEECTPTHSGNISSQLEIDVVNTLCTVSEANISTNNSDQCIAEVHTDTADTSINYETANSSLEAAVASEIDIQQTKPLPDETQYPKIMADHDRMNQIEHELSELKLQLNASQQARATLELQLTQKEEIIIKTQTECSRSKQELKQLKEKLEEKIPENDNTPAKELQETIKSLKAREAKLLSELNTRKNDEQNYRKVLEEYDKTISMQVQELQKFNEEHETVKQHLANLELAFSDVFQKYERSKKIIDGYKCNEDALRQTLITSEDIVVKNEQKYESLKAHAKAQLEKSNQEMILMRQQYDTELHKLTAIIRRLEIKIASLTDSLDQKTKECSALAALCDEVTGKV